MSLPEPPSYICPSWTKALCCQPAWRPTPPIAKQYLRPPSPASKFTCGCPGDSTTSFSMPVNEYSSAAPAIRTFLGLYSPEADASVCEAYLMLLRQMSVNVPESPWTPLSRLFFLFGVRRSTETQTHATLSGTRQVQGQACKRRCWTALGRPSSTKSGPTDSPGASRRFLIVSSATRSTCVQALITQLFSTEFLFYTQHSLFYKYNFQTPAKWHKSLVL